MPPPVNRTGCFAVSALQPPPSPSGTGEAKSAPTAFNYRLGVRLALGALVWLY